jgi:hypothetical protein
VSLNGHGVNSSRQAKSGRRLRQEPKASGDDPVGDDKGGPTQPRPRGSFIPPGYETRISALMSVIRFGPEVLSTAEFYALLYHVERSLPYGKESDCVSLSWMTNGIRKKGGGWLRGGSGLSKSGNEQGNRLLCARGVLKRQERKRPGRGKVSTEYTIQWPALVELLSGRAAQPSTHHAFQKSKGPCLPRKQRHAHQESMKQSNFHHQSNSYNAFSSQSAATDMKPETVMGTPQKPCKPAEQRKPEAVSSTAFPQKARPDDDDIPKPTSDSEAKEQYRKFLKKWYSGTGSFDIEGSIGVIARKIESFPGMWIAFLERVRQRAGKPSVLGAAFYTGLANELVKELQPDSIQALKVAKSMPGSGYTSPRVREDAWTAPAGGGYDDGDIYSQLVSAVRSARSALLCAHGSPDSKLPFRYRSGASIADSAGTGDSEPMVRSATAQWAT